MELTPVDDRLRIVRGGGNGGIEAEGRFEEIGETIPVKIRVRTLGEIANRCAHHHNFPIRLQGQGLAIFVVAKITGSTRSRPPIFTGILFLLGI